MSTVIDGSASVTINSGAVLGITSGTAVASTSGTSIDFTGIPSWVKRITVMFSGVSTNGTSDLIVQIGSGSFVATGYASGTMRVSAGTAFTTGFGITGGAQTAAYVTSGICILALVTGNTWVQSGSVTSVGATAAFPSGGMLALSGTLDRVRITTVNGTDAFDAGSINILYE